MLLENKRTLYAFHRKGERNDSDYGLAVTFYNRRDEQFKVRMNNYIDAEYTKYESDQLNVECLYRLDGKFVDMIISDQMYAMILVGEFDIAAEIIDTKKYCNLAP